jgi:hypothetical protein
MQSTLHDDPLHAMFPPRHAFCATHLMSQALAREQSTPAPQ